MKIFHNIAPAGDEVLLLGGFVQLPAPIDPRANGFAFYVTDLSGTQMFIRRELPAGADHWSRSLNKRLWTYVDPTGSVGGVTKVSIISIPLRGPNYYKVSVRGRKGNFMLPTSTLPINLAIVMGGPEQAIQGMCATRQFNPPGFTSPICRMVGTILVCR